MKKKINIILAICGLGFLIISFIVSTSQDEQFLTTRCGIVTYKSAEIYSPRKSTRIRFNNILYVKYSNKEIQENVDIRTYETNNVGDKVCFKSKDVNFIKLGFLLLLIGVLSLGISASNLIEL